MINQDGKVFALVFYSMVLISWYLVMFKGWDVIFYERICKYNKFIGAEKPVVGPKGIRILYTIALVFITLGFVLVLF